MPVGAAQVSANVAVFATLDSSFGAQWQTLTGLVDKFPSKDKLIASLQQSLSKNGVDFDKDIKQTVGPEVDFAVFDIGKTGAKAVGLTQPKDKAGFEAALKKGSNPAVSEEVGDWVLFSDTQADIDAFKALGGGKLSDDSSFKDAIAALPDGSLGRVYASGAALKDSLTGPLKSSGLGSITWAAAAGKAVSDGIRVDAVVRTSGGNASNSGADLLDKVPASAFAVLAFSGQSVSASRLDELMAGVGSGSAGQGLAQFETLTGVKLADVVGLFGGQGVLYMRAGSPIPEITLIEDGIDVDKGVTTLDTLATRLGALAHATPQDATVAGIKVKRLTIGPVILTYGNVDGELVLTTGATTIDDLKGGGSKLSDDAEFKLAQKDAGVSGDTAALFYVNVDNAFSTVASLSQIAGQGSAITPEANANAKHVHSFYAALTADGKDTLRIASFLHVQ